MTPSDARRFLPAKHATSYSLQEYHLTEEIRLLVPHQCLTVENAVYDVVPEEGMYLSRELRFAIRSELLGIVDALPSIVLVLSVAVLVKKEVLSVVLEFDVERPMADFDDLNRECLLCVSCQQGNLPSASNTCPS